MRCDEAAEYVSALCDGERVPREAAKHLDGCDACRTRLRDYVDMGVEMRRLASLETEEAEPQVWAAPKRGWAATWWQKGREAMRIPRFAFALLIVGIVGLGSGLAVEGVKARATGSVVLLRISEGPGQWGICALSAVDKKYDLCSAIGPTLMYRIQVLSRDGDRVNLGVRARSVGAAEEDVNLEEVGSLPEERYSFSPGKTLKVDVPGGGVLTLTGEWMDHLPVLGYLGGNLDPGANELRIVSPMMLRDNQIAGDVEGGSATTDEAGQAVFLFLHGQGSFAFSLSPMPGAVRGHVNVSRVTFEANGQHYALLTGTPIARASEIWILHNPEFQPPEGLSHAWFISTVKTSEVATVFQTAK